MLAAGIASLRLGKDANWDLRNYHLYNAYAFLAGRLGWDIAPAQAQTFHNPLADLPFYFLVRTIEDPRVIAFVMAAGTAVAAFFLLRLLVLLFPAGAPHRALSIAAAAAIGLTGAAGGPVVGSTMNEWHCAALLMPALFLVVRGAELERAGAAGHLLAGFLAGFAMGLKLTYGVFALGLVAAAGCWGPWGDRTRRVMRFSFGALLGFLLAYGYWAWLMQQLFASPLFPYFNDFFRSPYWEPAAWLDRRFGPRDALQALTFPLWFARRSELVAEGSFRDYRLAVLFVVALLVAARAAWSRASRQRRPLMLQGPTPAWRTLSVFVVVSYLAWLPLFSIYRYLVPLELVSGALIVAGIAYLLHGPAARRVAIVALTALLLGTTRFIGWERVPFGERYFDVRVPPVERDAVVVLGQLHPMAYAIPFFPREARFVSPANNLLAPGQQNLLSRRLATLLREHAGPLYLLEYGREPRLNDPTLAHFGLARGAAGCAVVRSGLDADAMRLCRLERR